MPLETMQEAEDRMKDLIVKESYTSQRHNKDFVRTYCLRRTMLNHNCFFIRDHDTEAVWIVTRETPESEWQKYKAN